MDNITHRLDQLTTSGTFVVKSPSYPSNEPTSVCMICSSTEHCLTECPSTFQFPDLVQEDVNATQSYTQPGNTPFSNTYNLSWRDHPNFGWQQNQGQQNMAPPRPNFQPYGIQQGGQPRFQNNPPPFNQPPQPNLSGQNNSSLEAKLDQILNAFQDRDSQSQSQQ